LLKQQLEGAGLLLTLIGGRVFSGEVLLDGVAREIERTGDSTDALAPDQMSAADLAYGFHAKHSRLTSAQRAKCDTTGAGQISTLFNKTDPAAAVPACEPIQLIEDRPTKAHRGITIKFLFGSTA